MGMLALRVEKMQITLKESGKVSVVFALQDFKTRLADSPFSPNKDSSPLALSKRKNGCTTSP